MKNLSILVVSTVILGGCTVFKSYTPYDIGEASVDTYMVAEAHEYKDVAEGMELAYEAMLQALDGPERDLPDDWRGFLEDIAEDKGFDKSSVIYAEAAVDRIRGKIRRELEDDEDVYKAYNILSEFRDGVDDRLEYWENRD